jgi:hypothetical protein
MPGEVCLTSARYFPASTEWIHWPSMANPDVKIQWYMVPENQTPQQPTCQMWYVWNKFLSHCQSHVGKYQLARVQTDHCELPNEGVQYPLYWTKSSAGLSKQKVDLDSSWILMTHTVIVATWEAQIRRTAVQRTLGKWFEKPHLQK